MDKKESMWGYIVAFVIVAAIGFGVYWMFLRPGNDPVTPDNGKNTQQETDTDAETDEDIDDGDTPADTPTDEEEETEVDSSDTDFTTYSNSQQVVGNSGNDAQYTLKSISDTKDDGFHKFTFLVQAKSSETMESPYTVVKYNSSGGVIRVDFEGITTDQSGIGYQKSRNIDEQGVIKLYHNISKSDTEELYDIGVAKATVFKVVATEAASNSWEIVVNIKYPGGNTTSESFGSSEFSKDEQFLEGAIAPDPAKISSYSFSSSGGVLSIVFDVSGSTSRPTPAASAKINGDGDLVLTFDALVSDAVQKAIDGKKVGSFTVDSSRSGNKSVYIFENADREFRLSASKSPNQVTLEIK